jgi:hypothetical protein
MKILHLTLKKKWFDMIASGEKKEEYREIKSYWGKRLVGSWLYKASKGIDTNSVFIEGCIPDFAVNGFKRFDYIHFANGYNRPRTVNVQCLGIEMGKGKKEWGAPDEDVFIIKLGEIIKN